MSIHRTIREGRIALKMTEQQFADVVGVSRGSVQQWEREGGTAWGFGGMRSRWNLGSSGLENAGNSKKGTTLSN